MDTCFVAYCARCANMPVFCSREPDHPVYCKKCREDVREEEEAKALEENGFLGQEKVMKIVPCVNCGEDCVESKPNKPVFCSNVCSEDYFIKIQTQIQNLERN